jgi:hypothetical protein
MNVESTLNLMKADLAVAEELLDENRVSNLLNVSELLWRVERILEYQALPFTRESLKEVEDKLMELSANYLEHAQAVGSCSSG